MKRVLDVGCGSNPIDVPDATVIGVDINESALRFARSKYPHMTLICASAEDLPFPDAYFDHINAGVSLPYMDIPKAIAEIRRVLKPGGSVRLAVHSFALELTFWRRASWKAALLYHPYVIANGLLLHFGLRPFPFPFNRKRIESFQTERGMRLLLSRGGFTNVTFTRERRGAHLECRAVTACHLRP